MILGGYEEELRSRFFGADKGLARRFPYVFTFKVREQNCAVDLSTY